MDQADAVMIAPNLASPSRKKRMFMRSISTQEPISSSNTTSTTDDNCSVTSSSTTTSLNSSSSMGAPRKRSVSWNECQLVEVLVFNQNKPLSDVVYGLETLSDVMDSMKILPEKNADQTQALASDCDDSLIGEEENRENARKRMCERTDS